MQACNFIKKETRTQVFSSEFWEISKNTFSYRALLVAASFGITTLPTRYFFSRNVEFKIQNIIVSFKNRKKLKQPSGGVLQGVLKNFAKFTGKHLRQSLFTCQEHLFHRTPTVAASEKRNSIAYQAKPN